MLKKLIITCSLIAAFGFTVPEGAENVKRYLDENGNERISYTINNIAVVGVKTNLKLVSVDPVSDDSFLRDSES